MKHFSVIWIKGFEKRCFCAAHSLLCSYVLCETVSHFTSLSVSKSHLHPTQQSCAVNPSRSALHHCFPSLFMTRHCLFAASGKSGWDTMTHLHSEWLKIIRIWNRQLSEWFSNKGGWRIRWANRSQDVLKIGYFILSKTSILVSYGTQMP